MVEDDFVGSSAVKDMIRHKNRAIEDDKSIKWLFIIFSIICFLFYGAGVYFDVFWHQILLPFLFMFVSIVCFFWWSEVQKKKNLKTLYKIFPTKSGDDSEE